MLAKGDSIWDWPPHSEETGHTGNALHEQVLFNL